MGKIAKIMSLSRHRKALNVIFSYVLTVFFCFDDDVSFAGFFVVVATVVVVVDVVNQFCINYTILNLFSFRSLEVLKFKCRHFGKSVRQDEMKPLRLRNCLPLN